MSIQVLEITQGDMFAASMIIMWFSAFASALIDNIPYVATMNPLIVDMAKSLWPDLSGSALAASSGFNAGMVVIGAGSLSWRQRDSHWRIGKCYCCRHCGKGRMPDFLQAILFVRECRS